MIGLRASGKSTVGPLVAARLQRSFTDLDDHTAAELNAPTAGTALQAFGEPAFRAAEATVLARLLQRAPGSVIALGGGTPMAAAARTVLSGLSRGQAVIFYLRVDPATLKRRLAADPTLRPSLTGKGTIDEVEELFAVRDPVYRALAHHALDAAREAREVAAEVVALGGV